MIYFVWLKCLAQAFTIKRLSEIITKLKKLSYRCIKRTENEMVIAPMTFKLRQMGFNLNHKTVLKLMNELGIHSILRKKRHGKRGKTSHIARIC